MPAGHVTWTHPNQGAPAVPQLSFRLRAGAMSRTLGPLRCWPALGLGPACLYLPPRLHRPITARTSNCAKAGPTSERTLLFITNGTITDAHRHSATVIPHGETTIGRSHRGACGNGMQRSRQALIYSPRMFVSAVFMSFLRSVLVTFLSRKR
ncbi:hypothetical protein [Parapedobacter sp.]